LWRRKTRPSSNGRHGPFQRESDPFHEKGSLDPIHEKGGCDPVYKYEERTSESPEKGAFQPKYGREGAATHSLGRTTQLISEGRRSELENLTIEISI
jgi:hypothetical protein